MSEDNELTATRIILEFVCPTIGVILANAMYLAPVRAVQRAVMRSHMGDLNPTPWAFQQGATIGWVAYGFFVGDYFVFAANAFPILIAVWLNLQTVKIQQAQHHEKIVRRAILDALEDQRQQEQQGQQLYKDKRRQLQDRGKHPSPSTTDEENSQHDQQQQQRTSPNVSAYTTTSSSSPSLQNYDRELVSSPSASLQQRAAGSAKNLNNDENSSELARLVWGAKAYDCEDDEVSDSKQGRTNSRPSSSHERIVIIIVTIWLAVISLVAFSKPATIPNSAKEIMLGLGANLNLIVFFAAPLSTIGTILRTRCTDSLHRPSLWTNVTNVSFWTAYGVAVRDVWVFAPNAIATVLGIIQVVLTMIFPRSRNKNDNNSDKDGLTIGAGGAEASDAALGKSKSRESIHDETEGTASDPEYGDDVVMMLHQHPTVSKSIRLLRGSGPGFADQYKK